MGLGLVLFILAGAPTPEVPEPLEPSLRGSPAAMREQHRVAAGHGLPFFRSRAEIRAALARGELVELPGSPDYEVADFVDPPFARPEARLFVERTAALYRQACGEPLVVTSAVRPVEEQPPNAHELSVHPAGIAVDLRVSRNQACREWLEAKLLELEERNLINGIRERRPPHYHVAIYPAAYASYVEERTPAAAEPAASEELPAGWGSAAWIALLIASLLALAAVGFLWWVRRQGRDTP